MRHLWIASIALAALVAACSGGSDDGNGGGDSTPARHIYFGTAVTYESDGGEVVAEISKPAGQTDAPGLLLLSEPGGSREDWIAIAPALVSAGYAVLAPELDYGEIDQCSTDPMFDDPLPDSECREIADRLLTDVDASLDYLGNQEGVDGAKLGIVGLGLGGNLGYVETGLRPDVTAVALSIDSSPPTNALVGDGYEGFKPRSVLFVTDERESGDSTALANFVSDPVRVRLYVGAAAHGGRPAHGLKLFDNEMARAEVFAWLQERLLDSAG